MYGFMCVSLTTAIWDNLATQLSLPVSMTHTTGEPESSPVVVIEPPCCNGPKHLNCAMSHLHSSSACVPASQWFYLKTVRGQQALA